MLELENVRSAWQPNMALHMLVGPQLSLKRGWLDIACPLEGAAEPEALNV